jgi:hypothetical protein
VAQVGHISWQEALRAGRVLFGPSFADASLASEAWRRELKRAFRRRAMETHPDRARALGRAERDLAREFDAVRAAFEVLSALELLPPRAAARPSVPRAAPPRYPPPRDARPPPQESRSPSREARPARAGPLPARRLRLAEFLYYSGRVPWTAYVESVAWQRGQRPALGRIAVEMGFLSQADVLALLARRRAEGAARVPIGAYAVGRGALTSFQRLAALGRQARLQRPIGAFFVETGMLRADELDALHGVMARHNARHPAA